MHPLKKRNQTRTKHRLLYVAIASMLLLSSLGATTLTMKPMQEAPEAQATTVHQPKQAQQPQLATNRKQPTDLSHSSASSPSPTKSKRDPSIDTEQPTTQERSSQTPVITTSDAAITPLAMGDAYWVDDDFQGNGSEATPANNVTYVLNYNVTEGDTINVEPGTYDDAIETFPLNITDHANVTLQSTTNASVTTIDASGTDSPAVNVTADGATINEFTFIGESDDSVIEVAQANEPTIVNNTFGPVSSLGEAVDNALFSWSTGGDANWFQQTNTTYYDGDAAESGDIGDNQATNLKTIIQVAHPGTLSFHWKVSSEDGSDFLGFYINGNPQDAISGTGPWSSQSYSLSPGSYTLTWEYDKDWSGSEHQDCGWVDRVTFTGSIDVNPPDEAIRAYNASHLRIENNDITVYERGIQLRYSSGNTITGNEITQNTGEGIYLDSVIDSSITNNKITNNNDEGIRAYNASHLRIENNDITYNVNYGINLYNPNSHSCLVESAHPYENGTTTTQEFNATDILGYQPEEIQLRFDKLEIQPGDYLYLTNAAGETVATATDIYISDTWGPWIRGDYANLTLVTNGTYDDFGYRVDQFRFSPVRKGNNEITGNYIANNNQRGIRLRNSGGNTITGNEITGNNKEGMILNNVLDSTITDNTITDNNADGIAIDPSTDNTITDNTITDNDGNGIYLEDSTTHTITYNVIKNNTEHGIRIHASNFTTITGNNITLNHQDGVNAYDVWNTSLSQNLIGCNLGDGIDLSDSANNRIQNNVIRRNGDRGVYIDNLVEGSGSISPAPDTNNYGNNLNETWTLNITDHLGYRPDYVRLYMIQVKIGPGDILYIKNAENETVSQFEEGDSATDFWTTWIEGGIVRFNLVTDCVSTAYGFEVRDWDTYDYISVREHNVIEGNEIKANLHDGMGLYDVVDTRIRENVIKENGGYAIYKTMSVDFLTTTTVSNNTITDNEYGVYLRGSHSSMVSDNTVTNTTGEAIHLYNANHSMVNNNTITNTTGEAIHLYNANHSMVNNNTITNTSEDAIHLEMVFNTTTIQGNTISESRSTGIFLQYGNTTIITNNTVSTSKEEGIYVQYAGFTTISANTIADGKGHGMSLDSLWNSTNVTGNTITGNEGEGLTIETTETISISNNTITHNENRGMYLTDSVNITVSGNDITENNHGVYVDQCGPNVTLTGNTITDHYYTGIFIREGSYLQGGFTISNNEVRANGKDGIALYNVANGTVSTNIIGNNYDGIQLSSGARKIVIVGNRIEQNNMGIDIEGAQAVDGGQDTELNVIRHNIFRDNYHGLYIHARFVMKPRDNQIYANDFVGNLEPAVDQTGENHFSNLTIGNFWSTYTGKDADGNGIGDTPYTIAGEGGSIDHLPSMSAFNIADTTAPSVSVKTPSEGEELGSTDVEVKWNGSDNTDIFYYEVKLDDGTWRTIGRATSYTFKGLNDGDHTVKVRAVDITGNTVEKSVTFTVNTSPIAGPGMLEEIAIGAAAAAAAIIGIGVYFWKRE